MSAVKARAKVHTVDVHGGGQHMHRFHGVHGDGEPYMDIARVPWLIHAYARNHVYTITGVYTTGNTRDIHVHSTR